MDRGADIMWWNHDSGWVMWPIMTLGVLGFAVLTAVLVLAVVRADRRPERPAPDARQVLERRLARGELDVDEYLERLSVLDQTHP